jgi:ribonuclease Z
MKLTLLGTGTPWPSAERQGSANLLQIGATNIMFDAGRGATTQLARLGMHPRDIDYIFITHHHFDHIASLDDLLLAAWNDGRRRPVYVFGPNGTKAIVDHLFNGIYLRDIVFRLKEAEFLGYEMPDIRDLVLVHDLLPQEEYETAEWNIRCEGVEHGHALGLDHVEWPCFGYRFEGEGKSFAISGDAIDCSGVRALAQDADVLLQCCYLGEGEITNSIKRLLSDHVLGSAKQANQIARETNVKKMILTHLAPKSEQMLDAVLAEAQAGYLGKVVLGEDLLSIEI